MQKEIVADYINRIPINIKNMQDQPTGKVFGNKLDYNGVPEILFITSYPPRECGIATYSQDLIKALNNKFSRSFSLKICPLESDNEKHNYSDEIKYILNTDHPGSFSKLAQTINLDRSIEIVMIQHKFGFFANKSREFEAFLENLSKPTVIVFHTVLPKPDEELRANVRAINEHVESIIVMTNFSANILIKDYGVPRRKITVIPHGTHLVSHANKEVLKERYNLSGRNILSTFGLISSGKSIETTLQALPSIIEINPEVLFLIIGKTHPTILNQEGEEYRSMLEKRVVELKIENHVKFINKFLPLPELLDYLQLTDVYLFTSRDPNQAVSGTFSYAISCGCPVISTPIPYAREVLAKNAGIIIDFQNSVQLSQSVIRLLDDEQLRKSMSSNGLHKMASTAWENSAVAHARLFESICDTKRVLQYKLPDINLNHIKKLTTDFGMIQFSKINQPDLESGYTLDDNARALIALCQHYELTKDKTDISYIYIYFNFIKYCMQSEGYFLNYVDKDKKFTDQNNLTNLADSNGRAIWALGYIISLKSLLPKDICIEAESILQNALVSINKIHSTRAMAFIIKGLYYYDKKNKSEKIKLIIRRLANRLVQMYKHEAESNWNWFESYLTYANSILSEAMLCAWLVTGEPLYKQIAKSSFDFLLSKIFEENNIHVISNRSWLRKEELKATKERGGEQPIDVAYTIFALNKFHDSFPNEDYRSKMQEAFNWFLGSNHLQQIIYNPCTGGCYDGLEENYVNLNQGAESSISYLMARLTIEKSLGLKSTQKIFKNGFTETDKQYKLLYV